MIVIMIAEMASCRHDCHHVTCNHGGVVLAGVEWAVADSKTRKEKPIISMSIGGSYSTIENQVMQQAHADGVPCVVAAGIQIAT